MLQKIFSLEDPDMYILHKRLTPADFIVQPEIIKSEPAISIKKKNKIIADVDTDQKIISMPEKDELVL